MTAQAGRDLLVRIANPDGPSPYVTVAGLRARTLTFDAGVIDVTTADAPGGWRELLAGAGLRTASVSGSGVFVDARADARLRDAFFTGASPAFQIVIPDFGLVEGPFQVSALEYAGRHDAELAVSMTLESAGPIVFTPEPDA